jgi:hypothetical protein
MTDQQGGKKMTQFSLEDLMSRNVRSWMPHKEADQPHGITGTVIKVTTTQSDFSDALVPVLEIVPDDDPEIIWRVTGYHGVLAREIADQRPAQGDRIGIRWQGEVEGAKATYHSYRVALERAEQPAVPIDWELIEKAAAAELGEDEEPFEDEDPE